MNLTSWFARVAARLSQSAQRPFFPLAGLALAFISTMTAIAFVPVLCTLVVARGRRLSLLVVCCAVGSALGAALLAWLIAYYGPQVFDNVLPRIARSQEWLIGIRWVDAFGFLALFAVAALPLSQTPVLVVCALLQMPLIEIVASVFAGKLISTL